MVKRLRDNSTFILINCLVFSYEIFCDEIRIDASVRQSDKRASQKIGIGWSTRCCAEVPYVRLLLTADNNDNVRIRTKPSFVFLSSAQETRFTLVLHPVHRRAKTYNSCLLCLVHARDFRLSNRGFWVTAARESEGSGDLVNPGSVSPLRNRADSNPWKRLSMTRLTGSRK